MYRNNTSELMENILTYTRDRLWRLLCSNGHNFSSVGPVCGFLKTLIWDVQLKKINGQIWTISPTPWSMVFLWKWEHLDSKAKRSVLELLNACFSFEIGLSWSYTPLINYNSVLSTKNSKYTLTKKSLQHSLFTAWHLALCTCLWLALHCSGRQ